MQTELFNLRRKNRKTFIADEKFWSNVEYMTFHSAHLEIKLKRGRPIKYLHYWFFEIIENEQSYIDEKKQEIYEEEGCSYCFPKENEEFLDFLYKESKKRKLIEYAM